MPNKVKVSFPVKNEPLSLHLFFILLLTFPVLGEHALLLSDGVLFVLFLLFSCQFLPLAHRHGLAYSLLLLLNLNAISFFLLHLVQLPKLSIDVIFLYLLLHPYLLVHELPLSLDLAVMDLELGALFSKLIGSYMS